MNNPWLKKNPFLSLWLSGANRIVGVVRGQSAAQLRRSMQASVAQASEENLKRWFATTTSTPSPVRRKPKKAARTARR